MSGAEVPNATASYGTQGVPSPSNKPGARYAGQAWSVETAWKENAAVTGSAGVLGEGQGVHAATAGGTTQAALWLFGGYGYDAQGHRHYLNDVWVWSPSS